MGMMGERGNIWLRRADFYCGVPLVNILGSLRRLRHRPCDIHAVEPRSIVFICLGAIGDMLLATALFHAVAARYPQAKLTVIATRANAEALSLLDPCLGRAIFPIRAVGSMLRYLRQSRPDLLIDTTQWARLGALISILSGASCTIGFDSPGQFRGRAYDLAVQHRNDRHEVENFLALARTLDPGLNAAPRLHIAPHAPAWLPGAAFPPPDRVIYLHMFGSGLLSHLKAWTPEAWRELALFCQGAGYAVCFTGSAADAGRVEAFLDCYIPADRRGNGLIRSLAGQSTLAELAWLFQGCAAVVSVNTGILHLASLSGAPTVDLHGSTNPARWGGLGPRVVSLVAPGSDTAYLNHGFEYLPGAEATLRRLPVAEVLAALRGLGVRLQ